MWVVTLHFDDGYKIPWSRAICGCETEDSAHEAGIKLANFYNYDPFSGYSEPNTHAFVGFSCTRKDYSYTVKKHSGEWKGRLRCRLY